MKKLAVLLLPAVMLIGCGANSSSSDNKDSVQTAETTVAEVSEIQMECATENNKEKIINAAKEYVSGLDEFSTITNYDFPEFKEVTELPDYYHITDDFIKDNKRYEVTFLTTADALLGPIVVYADSNGTVFGLGFRE